MNRIIYILIIAVLASVVVAQPGSKRSHGAVNSPNPQMQGDRIEERMEMMMTWKLTNDLDLTSEQAEKFFPRLKEHRENMEKLEEEIYTVSKEIRSKIDKEKEISNAEFKTVLDKVNELEKQKVDEKERFVNELEDILTINQRAKLALFKQYFVRDIRKQIRNRTQEGT